MSDVRGLFPRVGLKGQYTFSGPFETYTGYDMEVIADKSFDYYATRGRDILSEIYEANEISEETYNQHRTVGVRIITLRYHGKLVVDIPSIYIIGIPDEDVNFKWFQFVVSLGILPKDIDLTRVKETVEEVLLEEMGITTEVLLSSSELLDKVTIEDLEINELARKNAIQNASTYLKDKMLLEQQVEDLRGQVDHLMNLIYDADIRP